MAIKFLSKVNLKKYKSRTAVVRIDLNIEGGGAALANHPRVKAILPTIQLLLKSGVRVVMLSHRGRPVRARTRADWTPAPERSSVWGAARTHTELSLKPFAGILSKELKRKVVFLAGFDFRKNKKIIHESKEKIFLLENIRFLPGEEKNSPALAKQLASLGDFYVNDAFAVSHRAAVSTVAVTKFLPSYAGLLLEREITTFDEVAKKPAKPLTVIIGGAKISDKLGVIENFWKKADYFLLGGGPANTFFAAQGLPMGSSLVNRNYESRIRNYAGLEKIVLPVDLKFRGREVLDIGPRTVKKYGEIIRKSRTIIWNGPMGVFEKKGFEKGTLGIWKAILANKKAQIVVGGGETIASAKLISNFEFRISNLRNVSISTGGGAMLAYLAGEKLPGIEALKRT